MVGESDLPPAGSPQTAEATKPVPALLETAGHEGAYRLSQPAVLRSKAALVQVSDFGLGRGKFIADALRLSGLDVVAVTNRAVYQGSHEKGGEDRGTVQFGVPFTRVLFGTVFGRLLFYLAFSALAFARLVRERPAVLYSRGPQPFTELSCLAYRLFSPKAIVVSDTTDLWPDSLEHVAMNPWARKVLVKVGYAVSRKVYERVDSVVTHNDIMAAVLDRRFHRPLVVIPGVIDLSSFGSVGKAEATDFVEGRAGPVRGRFVVLYAGLMGPFQNPRAILEVAARTRTETLFLIVGRGPMEEEVRKEALSLGLTNVVFLGTQPFGSMPSFYGAADACLLTYADLPFLKIGLPKKFIEYAASARPILCIAPDCVAGQLCVDWDAGRLVPPEDFDGAADFLAKIREDPRLRSAMGRNARRMAETLFSEEGASRTLSLMLVRAVRARGPRIARGQG